MNAAPMHSPRLQRVLAVLAGGGWHTTRDIVRCASVCAVNSCIAELRQNGVAIETKMSRVRGRPVWRYRLLEGT